MITPQSTTDLTIGLFIQIIQLLPFIIVIIITFTFIGDLLFGKNR